MRILSTRIAKSPPSGRSAAWLARLVRDQEVEGSNPFAPTIYPFPLLYLRICDANVFYRICSARSATKSRVHSRPAADAAHDFTSSRKRASDKALTLIRACRGDLRLDTHFDGVSF